MEAPLDEWKSSLGDGLGISLFFSLARGNYGIWLHVTSAEFAVSLIWYSSRRWCILPWAL